MRLKAFAILVSLAVVLNGCKGAASSDAAADASVAPTTHTESGLTVVPLVITHGGTAQVFKVELAQTPQQQARGLMFRTRLAPDEGMLFPFDPPRPASFWMKDTVIPLDLLFIAPDGRVTNIAANARPYDESKLQSLGAVKAVLEIPGGRAAELGLAPGDVVSW